MKISILSPDLSHNCLGRAYLLAKVLQNHFDIEIVGPAFTKGIWEPVLFDKSIKYKIVEIHGGIRTYCDLIRLSTRISGDVLYAVKPLMPSYGVGLINKCVTGRPLLLDIDDWQMGFIKEIYANYSYTTRIKKLLSSAFSVYDINSYWNSYLAEKLVSLAGTITVSNTFLKDKFGGTIIYHGRNTDEFDPERYDSELMKVKYGFKKDQKVVAFLGTPRAHKGIEDLIAAVEAISDQNLILFLAGFQDHDVYSQNLRNFAEAHLGKRIKISGLHSFEDVPKLLSASDIVVIPQRHNSASVGQLPAKVFDAMAMARPIIATRVNDLHDILSDCGLIVEPNSPPQLARAIRFVLDHPDQAARMADRARQKCIEHYSWKAMANVLVPLISEMKQRT